MEFISIAIKRFISRKAAVSRIEIFSFLIENPKIEVIKTPKWTVFSDSENGGVDVFYGHCFRDVGFEYHAFL